MTQVKDLDCAKCAKPLANETHAVAEDWQVLTEFGFQLKTKYLCPACGDDVD